MSDAVATAGVSGLRSQAEPRLRWSPGRVAGTLVLVAWATLFWFLLATGREAFYLSTRTDWVVPIAAVLLTAAAAGRLASARIRSPEPLRSRELWIHALMVVPVLLVMVLPAATLGSFSAGSRAEFGGAGVSVRGIGDGALTLVDVAAAQTTPEGERALAKRAGEVVAFVGFVTRYADTPADELLLTRYVVTCCVADATVAQVRVVNVTPGAFDDNEWIEVSGAIYPLGREVIVNASSVEPVPRPERPYLTA
ncbi:MAG TPA: TIGR03943 family protein [Actinomycetota bacterium]|nr:TIGR03943 family protein [Actinomycetota bacterium]